MKSFLKLDWSCTFPYCTSARFSTFTNHYIIITN